MACGVLIIDRVTFAKSVSVEPALLKRAEVVRSMEAHQNRTIAAVALAQRIGAGGKIISLTIKAKHSVLVCVVITLPIWAVRKHCY